MDQLRSELTRDEGARRAGALIIVALLGAGCSASTPPAGGSEARFGHGFESPQALGRELLAALHHGDLSRLEQLALDESEFRDTVWPALPASNPEIGLPVEYAWGELRQKSRAHLRETLEAYRGVEMELIDLEFQGETTDYRSFRVYRDSILHVRRASGEQERIRAFGSMIEHDGRVKVFSYVVD